jgi:hypothetical protein
MTARRLAGFTVGTLTVATSLAAAGLVWMAATDPLGLAALTTASDLKALAAALVQRLIELAL